MSINKIPVYIITGFLGSGKTTFVNGIIKAVPEQKIIVIENEIGSVNIDGALIASGVESVIDLTAGCLCCNLNEKLYDLLYELEKRRGEFDILVVETTGIADPASVAETFWLGGFMSDHYEIKSTICVADVKHIRRSMEETEEARRQISFADIVVFNKCDLAGTSEIAEVKKWIAGFNPSMNHFEGSNGYFPYHEILTIEANNNNSVEDRVNKSPHLQAFKHHDLQTFTLTFTEDFDLAHLRHTLTILIQINRSQIYRIKGFIAVHDDAHRLVLQSVYQSFRLTEGSKWPEGEARISKLVFIGKAVEKQSIENVFKKCFAKPVIT